MAWQTRAHSMWNRSQNSKFLDLKFWLPQWLSGSFINIIKEIEADDDFANAIHKPQAYKTPQNKNLAWEAINHNAITYDLNQF